ncbi:MAG: glycosyltransferase family 39 protein, partial [Caulobacteraceae bacterium]|nr:glycosyltransferase family 39 protein [Caulobacteraceae bacterium]
VAAGDWVLPDGPLILGLLAATTGLADGWFPATGEKPRPLLTWLWAGFWIGVAALSKYQAALYCVGLIAFVLSVKERRRELFTPGPYLAALLTLSMLSPVLIWNSQHGWASFAFQGGRGAPHGFTPLSPLTALAGQMALLTPWLFVPLAAAGVSAWRGGPADKRRWFCLMLALPAIALFTLSPLVGPRTLPHWSMPGWLFLFPLLGRGLSLARLDGRRWPRTWALASLAVLLVVGAAGVQEAATGWMGAAFPKLFKKGDPTAESIEWSSLRGALARQGLLDRPGIFVVALKWNEAGKIDAALKGAAPVLAFSGDPREFGYRPSPAGFLGRDAVILGRSGTVKGALPGLAPYFHDLGPVQPLWIGRDGRQEIEVDEVIGHDLLKAWPDPLR